MAIMAITTNNSIKVNDLRIVFLLLFWVGSNEVKNETELNALTG
jgi:hypothetical protein